MRFWFFYIPSQSLLCAQPQRGYISPSLLDFRHAPGFNHCFNMTFKSVYLLCASFPVHMQPSGRHCSPDMLLSFQTQSILNTCATVILHHSHPLFHSTSKPCYSFFMSFTLSTSSFQLPLPLCNANPYYPPSTPLNSKSFLSSFQSSIFFSLSQHVFKKSNYWILVKLLYA